MENLPFFIDLIFILVAIITVWLFFKAAHQSAIVAVVLGAWLLIQSLVSKSGFYTNNASTLPHFALAIVPPFLLIATIFILPAGRRFADSLDLKTLTLLHVVRVPVEIVLLLLFLHKAVPGSMTFEGRNFDILSGLTAPLLYYFVFIKKRVGYNWLLAWNIICLGLLLNIVIIALLSAPLRFQQLSFDQPNKAILYFPFVWLPGCIVPLVFFCHLVAIRHVMLHKKKSTASPVTVQNAV